MPFKSSDLYQAEVFQSNHKLKMKSTFSVLSLFVFVIMVLLLSANAQTGEEGNKCCIFLSIMSFKVF